MTTLPSPCRLSVFLSRKTNVGVVLRRGPSEWTQLIRWDRKTDRFTLGQWFHGRVYERRCDLSPNGELFIYFAAKHGPRQHTEEDIGEAWTAISKPPYFTALALWPNLGSWYGGGVFVKDNTVLLDVTCNPEPHPDFRPHKLKIRPLPGESAPWEQRLLRDGWQLVERGFDPRTHRRVGAKEIWEKQHPSLPVKLCRQVEDVDFKRFGGPYLDTLWLEVDDELVPLEHATWADWECWDRLVFVRDGRLFAASLDGTSLTAIELFDFNPNEPQQVETPNWARRWS
ncbi:MAG: hypothetical protein OEU36_04895 [Gammaproteobacteria bacterium]|nr:hypothetical protein [Gammaproteobacteria bacterium]